MDLLLIRIASYNQIIDPWVYILLRKEVLWKLISGVKFVLGIRKKEGDILVYQIQQKQNVEDSEEKLLHILYWVSVWPSRAAAESGLHILRECVRQEKYPSQ